MLKFAANLSLMYPEFAFLERFGAAAADGFKAVEFMFPYEYSAAEIKAQLDAHGLQLVLLNAPAGGELSGAGALDALSGAAGLDAASVAAAWAAGARGLAALPGREAQFRASIRLALHYAAVLGAPRLHVMAGILPPEVARADAQATYTANLRWAAGQAQKQGVEVLIEPINPRDMPRYFLNRQDHAHEIAEALNLPNLKVQMDLYHCQITEGDLTAKLRQYLPTGRVAHLQIAGVPGRHEPDVGEVNYAFVLAELQALIAQTGWDGWVGCEYRPARGAAPGSTRAGLGWMAAWRGTKA